jgi:cytochrome c-type biogenesis protein CcmH/NrfG
MPLLTPDSGQLLQEAYAQRADGAHAQAERLCNSVLAGEPRNALAMLLLGMLRVDQGLYAEAAVVLGDTAQLVPDHPDVHLHLGLALQHLGRQ